MDARTLVRKLPLTTNKNEVSDLTAHKECLSNKLVWYEKKMNALKMERILVQLIIILKKEYDCIVGKIYRQIFSKK